MAATPARLAAARALTTLEVRGGPADAVLDDAGPGLDTRERALALALVQGVERNRTLYDHLLAPHCRRPLAALDPDVRAVLRASVHQFRALDRVPERAVLHQAGELCRDLGVPRAVGFVSGVLHAWLRSPDRAKVPDRGRAAIETACSLPGWITSSLVRMLGEEGGLQAARAFGEMPPLTLRVNRLRTDPGRVLARLGEAGIAASPGALAPGAIVLTGGGDPRALPGWQDGWFTVQDEAAQVVGALSGAGPGEAVLDLCAAPGGKALQAAESVNPGGRVVAADLDEARLRRVLDTAARLGVPGIETRVHDARTPFPGPPFARVLLDAPCTGLGTLRRHPEVRWQRTPSDVHARARAQAAMLEAAASATAPGGRLVYAVCSFLPEEGEGVVGPFLSAHPGWTSVPAGPAAARTADGFVRTWPHLHGTDAFFAATLERAVESRA